MKNIVEKINWKKMSGLVPVIVQDIQTSRVLMLAYTNKEALEKTFSTGKVWFYSRSRQKLWMKGEESENYLYLVDVKIDCDADALLIKAKPAGPTCHQNTETCFGGKQQIDIGIFAELYQIIENRKKEMPENSYTSSLFKEGLEKICSKIEEESEEVCRAAKTETKQRLIEESVDVLYHLLVLLVNENVELSEVLKEVKSRSK